MWFHASWPIKTHVCWWFRYCQRCCFDSHRVSDINHTFCKTACKWKHWQATETSWVKLQKQCDWQCQHRLYDGNKCVMIHPDDGNQQQWYIKHYSYSHLSSGCSVVCTCCHISVSISYFLCFYLFLIFPSLWSLSSLLRACTHIKWRATVRFQFRTHLWCCRPPTRSAVAEGTQGSPITALYANALAPGQQRGHAGTASLFMQISGRQSQHRAGHRHQWSYLPTSTTVSSKH